jgi:hypothetical protein
MRREGKVHHLPKPNVLVWGGTVKEVGEEMEVGDELGM